MKIQYLGTAAAEAWPGIFCRCEMCKEAMRRGGKNLRTRSQALIDGELLVDFPADSYFHMLQHGLDLPNIRNLIVTHSHMDHFHPMDLGMRTGVFASSVEFPLHIYGNDKVEARFLQAMGDEYKGNWTERDDGTRLVMHRIEAFAPLEIGSHRVTPLLALHDRSERCLTYLIEREGQALLYANDTGLFPQETWDFLAGRRLDLVSMDCTTGKFQEGINHMGLPDNVEMMARLEELGCLKPDTVKVITHFSHNGGLLHEELEAAAKPHGFLVAYDGFAVEC